MFEFTHGGAGFRWSTLDRASKRLAGASFACAAVAGGAAGFMAQPVNNSFGLDVSSLTTPLACLFAAAALLAAVLWYRFSLRQDEMFNRVQSWALGMGGAWTCLIATGWMLLAKGNIFPPISTASVSTMFIIMVCAFWLIAARKWAL